MARVAGGSHVGWLAFFRVTHPNLRIRSVTSPTRFARSVASDAGVFGASCHRRRLAADDPEDCKQGDYAGSDGEKVKVFSIHKAGRVLQRRR